MRHKLLTVGAVMLALPASAAASVSHYFPRPHHACRAHYVRRVVKLRKHRHGRVVILRRAECADIAAAKPTRPPTSTLPGGATPPVSPAPPITPPIISTGAPTTTSVKITDSMTTWFSVWGSVYDGNGQQLVGEPLTYVVTDTRTGQQIASFTGTSNSYSSCAVVYSISPQGVKTYSGQPVPPVTACNLQPFSMPAADPAMLTAYFSGDSTYAGSKSSPVSFS